MGHVRRRRNSAIEYVKHPGTHVVARQIIEGARVKRRHRRNTSAVLVAGLRPEAPECEVFGEAFKVRLHGYSSRSEHPSYAWLYRCAANQPTGTTTELVPPMTARYDPGAMSLLNRIEKNPKVMGGKPVLRGTRITVEHILKELEAGGDPIHLLEHGHPELGPEDLLACIEFGEVHYRPRSG